jgi:hypothetical protein
VLRVRTDDIDTSGSVMPEVDPPPGPESAHAQPLFGARESPGYWLANDVRLVRGSWMEAGPGTAWFRLQCPVLDGVTPSPVVRVAACADFGSGVGNALRLTNANAINAEVTIHLHRHPASEWVCLESGSWAHSHGVGLADSLILDRDGPVGRVAQSLVVESATRLNFAVDPR